MSFLYYAAVEADGTPCGHRHWTPRTAADCGAPYKSSWAIVERKRQLEVVAFEDRKRRALSGAEYLHAFPVEVELQAEDRERRR